MAGFVTRASAKGRSGKTMRSTLNSVARMRMAKVMGPELLEGINPDARNPHLSPHVDEGAKVYFLLGSPSKRADVTGDPLAGFGPSVVDGAVDFPFALDYVCRTALPDDRTPEAYEAEAYREQVEQSIIDSGARVIVLCSHSAVKWATGESFKLDAIAGRHWPGMIGDTPVRFFANLSPVYLGETIEEKGARGWRISDRLTFFGRTVDRAEDMADKAAGRPFPAPLLESEANSEVEILTDVPSILKALKALEEEAAPIAYDIETTALRPYGAGARISTIAFASDSGAIAFPWKHANVGFDSKDRREIRKAVRRTMVACPVVIAHNHPFEMEWMLCEFSREFLYELNAEDTMQQAYILDERQGALSLNWLSIEHFGLALKGASDVNVKFVEANPLSALLRYNALDALLTLKIWKKQKRTLKARELVDIAAMQNTRVRTCVIAQHLGFPVDQEEVSKHRFALEGAVELIKAEIKYLPEVKEFEAGLGPFNPASNAQLASLLSDLERSEIVRDGKVTVDEEALVQIKSGPGSKLAKQVLGLRTEQKKLSTYILPLDVTSEDSVVWADGSIHTQFKISRTATGRLSSADPNVQNYPQRSAAARMIRKCFQKLGHLVLSMDFAQLEACVIAMLSRDSVWMKMVSEGYDAHTEWSEIIADAAPDSIRKAVNAHSWKDADAKQRKAFRSIIKNKFVFPAFFGARSSSIAGYLHIDERVCDRIFDRFWGVFSGVKEWQQRLQAQYERDGYVVCGTGRRRRGPFDTMSMVLNSPVQGSASDIVVEAMIRIADEAQASGREYLFPRLNIHDDLTFLVPEDKVQEVMDFAMPEMVRAVFPFQCVPLSVEAEVGPSWGEKTQVGACRGGIYTP